MGQNEGGADVPAPASERGERHVSAKTRADVVSLLATVGFMLIDQIRADMTAAMKSRDVVVLRTTRAVIAAVQEASVAGPSAKTLSDDDVENVIRAQAKRRIEAAEAFDIGDRPERAAAERDELAVLETYLPKGLSDDELGALVDSVLTTGGFSSMADMGNAMKAVNAEVAGRADGRVVAAFVKARLAG